MTLSRQDAWSADDDIMLAEIVLRHVREGSTQLSAFQEAGQKLSRTAAACGFRWNACIRKKYESAIEMARTHKGGTMQQPVDKQKMYEESDREITIEESPPDTSIEREKVEADQMLSQLRETISFLTNLSQFMVETNHEKMDGLVEKKEAVQQENEKLETELQQVKRDFKRLREDYKALLDVMEKARALSEGALPYLHEEEIEESG
ncbi:RsfA family transcriptional regulator [Salibacterium salarium]|uniref:RsfA family transcriptional regulator n=2 Tax=Salibacterium salarium TaxID=284579 RepID=A0A428MYU1_9BACI|nr:RsfA family transcriptional regulator [Salibacterium salarium]